MPRIMLGTDSASYALPMDDEEALSNRYVGR